jgi:protein FAM32A
MSGFVGGKLKLKGGEPVQGGVKKKKKKSTGSEAALALTSAGSGDAGTADGTQAAAAAEPVKTKDGYVLPAPSAHEDRRTEAQKRHDERVRKLEEERLRKHATKGYRDRVKDFNEHLASLSEHHDIPKVSVLLLLLRGFSLGTEGAGGVAGGVCLHALLRCQVAGPRWLCCLVFAGWVRGSYWGFCWTVRLRITHSVVLPSCCPPAGRPRLMCCRRQLSAARSALVRCCCSRWPLVQQQCWDAAVAVGCCCRVIWGWCCVEPG